MGINSTLECRQLVTDLNKKLYWIYGHSYQLIESSFPQKWYYASLRDRLKEGPQWVNCVVLITTLLQHCTFQEYVLNCQSLATMLASSWWSSRQDMGFCGLGMANSESGYHNLFSFGYHNLFSSGVRCRNFLGGPSVGFRRYRPCRYTSHLIWTSCWM